jgi:hypothetical protein
VIDLKTVLIWIETDYKLFYWQKEVFFMREATELLRYSLEDELKRITNIIIEKCN